MVSNLTRSWDWNWKFWAWGGESAMGTALGARPYPTFCHWEGLYRYVTSIYAFNANTKQGKTSQIPSVGLKWVISRSVKLYKNFMPCVHNFQCETIFIRAISLSKWQVIPISLWRSPNRLAQFHVPPKIAQLSAHKCRQQNTSVLKPGGPGTFQRSSLPNFSCLWRQDASQNQTIRSTLKDYYVVPRLVHLG